MRLIRLHLPALVLLIWTAISASIGISDGMSLIALITIAAAIIVHTTETTKENDDQFGT